MTRRLRKVPQPAIDPLRRPSEWRPIWLGLAAALVGAVILIAGLLVTRGIAGGPAGGMREWQIVKAAAQDDITPKGLRSRARASTQPSQPTSIRRDDDSAKDCST